MASRIVMQTSRNVMVSHENIMECHADKHHHARIMEIKHLMKIDMDMATSWKVEIIITTSWKVEIIMSTSWKESLGNMEEESHMGWKPPWKVP
jgi:hypothetical protein